MFFSIIIATYNSEKFITDCLDSIYNQKFNSLEVIVIDNKSKDQTLNKIKKHKLSIKKIISKKDNGIYEAFNKGIKITNGQVVGFLNSDDVLEKNVLKNLHQIFIRNKCISGVYGNLRYFSKHNKEKIVRNWISGKYNFNKLSSGWMIPHPTLYIKKKIFNEVGHFNTNYKISGDYDFILRLLKKNISIYYHNAYMVKMRSGGISNRSLKSIFLKMFEDLQIIKKNKIGSYFTLLLKNINKINQFFL